MIYEELYTDEWGVTYSNYGRVLMEVNPQLFTCEEYSIPEGVEVLEGDFFFKNAKLRKITLPGTLRKMEANAFIHCPLENLELPEGLTEIPEFMCECCRTLKKVVLPSTIKKILAHPTFRVMRQSCSAYSLSLKYLSSLKPYALRFITFILLFIPSTLAVEI